MDDIEEARAAARAKADEQRQKFFDTCRRDFDRWSLERDDERFLSLITRGRISDRALLCNERVRRRFQYSMIDAALADYQAHPERQWLWITLCWDGPVTWERKPEIDAMTIVNTATQHLRRCDLDGVGVLEIDVWKNITGEPGRRVVPHVHFLGYPTHGDRYEVESLEAAMCGRGALANSLGAKPVVIEEIEATPARLANSARYMAKPPAWAKNPVPIGNGEHRLKDVDHAKGSAARLAEILSYVELGNALFAIGDGKTVAGAVRREVREEIRHSRQTTPAPSRERIEQHFRRVMIMNRSANFEECQIKTRRDR